MSVYAYCAVLLTLESEKRTMPTHGSMGIWLQAWTKQGAAAGATEEAAAVGCVAVRAKPLSVGPRHLFLVIGGEVIERLTDTDSLGHTVCELLDLRDLLGDLFQSLPRRAVTMK